MSIKLGGAWTFTGTNKTVHRMGFGAMQLAGPKVWGPPCDRARAVRVLREAVAAGVNHIDTSDFYGPHVVNEIIREALHPYPAGLTLVTKVGAKRGPNAEWLGAETPAELEQAVEDNLRRLAVESLHIVNYRVFGHGPTEERAIAEGFGTLARLQQRGWIEHLGISHATRAQVGEARSIAPVVCVQNMYNLAQRADDPLIDELGAAGIAYVPYFPLGGFTPLQAEGLTQVAAQLGATPMQVALAWLLQRAPNILLIPGTSSPEHLAENLAAAELHLPQDVLGRLEAIGTSAA